DEAGAIDESEAREVNDFHAAERYGTRAAFHVRLSPCDRFEPSLRSYRDPAYLELADAELTLDSACDAPAQVNAIPGRLFVFFKRKRSSIGSVRDSDGLRVLDLLQTSIESVSALGQ